MLQLIYKFSYCNVIVNTSQEAAHYPQGDIQANSQWPGNGGRIKGHRPKSQYAREAEYQQSRNGSSFVQQTCGTHFNPHNAGIIRGLEYKREKSHRLKID